MRYYFASRTLIRQKILFIHIKPCDTPSKKQFSIRDSGSGIAPEHLPHIYERLYRAEKSRSRQTGGLGIGLYIVKQLVLLHGWTIAVESQLAKGTVFTIDWHLST